MTAFWRWLCSLFRHRPSPPPVPPAPQPRVLAVDVWGRPLRDKVAGALVQALAASGLVEARTNEEGNVSLSLPHDTVGVALSVTADEYDRWEQTVTLADGVTSQSVDLVPTFRPLPRLVPYRQCFRLENGTPFTVIMASDFNLFARHQAGEDIRPILAQRQDCGFNFLRVFTLFEVDGIGTLREPDYAKLPAFLDLCARYGLYVELVAYAGRLRDAEGEFTVIPPQAHWTRLLDAVQGKTNYTVEAVNEGDQTMNALPYLGSLQRPSGFLVSHGSNGSQKRPVEPVWSYAGLHTNDSGEDEARKAAHNPMEDIADAFHVPAIVGETSRFPEVGIWQRLWLDRNRQEDEGVWLARCQRHGFDIGAGSTLLHGGSCWHCVSGKLSVLFTAAEEAVAREWTRGARSVNLACQDGLYYHRADLETAEDSRVYERRWNGGSAIVRIRK